MQILTVKDIRRMGEPDEEGFRTYWGSVEELDKPVRFILKKDIDFYPGRNIMSKREEERPGKKSPYVQLFSVAVADKAEDAKAVSKPTSTTGKPIKFASEASTASNSRPDYELGTNARWALKLSVDTYKTVIGGMPDSKQDFDKISDFALWLLDSFDAITGTQVTAAAEVPIPSTATLGSEASESDDESAGDFGSFDDEDETRYQ